MKLIRLLTVSNLFALEVVQSCQHCQLCVLRENSILVSFFLADFIFKESDFREAMDLHIVGMFKGEKGLADFMGANRFAFNNWANELLSNQDLLEEIGKAKFDLAVLDGAVMARHHYLVKFLFYIHIICCVNTCAFLTT